MSTRLCSVLIILSAMSCSSASAQDVPKGEAAFTEYVAAQLRREMGGAAIVVKGPLTLAVGELQANLDRIFAYCSRDRTGCAREISTYVKGVAQVHKDRLTPPSKEAVRVLVRTQAYVTMSQAALPKQALKLQPRELAGGLVMLPAIDMPRSLRMLTDEDNVALGLSADEVFKLGFANLRQRLKPLMEVAKVVQPGQIGHLSGDVYHPSRLALRESWSPLAKAHGGKLIVAVPTTDTVLYVGDDAPTAIDALRALAKNVWARAPNQLSTELLRWTPKRWEVVR
jgi:uncharacterized protein YtpQ (UPF0354 family)